MFLKANAMCDTRRARLAKPIKVVTILNKGVQTALFVIFMSSVVACKGVPLFPAI